MLVWLLNVLHVHLVIRRLNFFFDPFKFMCRLCVKFVFVDAERRDYFLMFFSIYLRSHGLGVEDGDTSSLIIVSLNELREYILLLLV